MTQKRRFGCVVLGAGGHARLVIDAIIASGDSEIVAILDPNTALWGSKVLGISVIGGDDQLEHLISQGVDGFVIGVGPSAGMDIRRKLYLYGCESGLRPISVCHPAAVCSSSSTLGAGVQIMPNAVIGPGVSMGKNVAVNAGAVVEHDCRLADHVFVGSGATVCGSVEIAEGAFIGAGATVRQLIKIGAASVLGAGAVAVSDIPAGAVAIGVPARSE